MVTILLATYNGERYLEEQIESILQQTYTDWELIIQDDCSSDGTAVIALNYVKHNPYKIRFIRREFPSGSAKNNFFSMLKLAKSDYVMTCDQDDVWLPAKVEVSMSEMHRLEADHGYNKPLLVHTDLKVVDYNLSVIAESMFKRQNLDNHRDKLNNLLVQNIVTGCTTMVNRALLDMVYEVPKEAIMHDRWLALIACAFGKIGFLDQSTVLYRQHGSNEVGDKDTRSFWYNLKRLSETKQSTQALQNTYLQAQAFLKIYGEMLLPKLLELVREYSLIPEYGKIRRLQTISRYHFWKKGFARKCGQILFCLL